MKSTIWRVLRHRFTINMIQCRRPKPERGAISMLGLTKHPKASIFQASTSEIYGDPDLYPLAEGFWGEVNPSAPRSCNDEGKHCAGTLGLGYQRQHGINIKVVRIFNVYGPRMHSNEGYVVSNFIVQVLKGNAITLFGDGAQSYSFCYVDDLIEDFGRLIRMPEEFTDPMNLRSSSEYTMIELADIIKGRTGSKSEVIHKPLPIDDPKQRKHDIRLAKAATGWEPRNTLEQGLI